MIFVATTIRAFAYDFSAVAPSGQTLYYNFSGEGCVEVTSENTSDPFWSTEPVGSLEIPASVTYNGTTYSVTEIGYAAFSGCSDLYSVAIPGSVTVINTCAFTGCSGLTGVLAIPESVDGIGYAAFSFCKGLASVTIPNSVTSIGDRAFEQVRHIAYYGSATGAPWGADLMNGVIEGDFVFTNASKNTLSSYIGTGGAVVIPSSVTAIGDRAFMNCHGLTSVTIGNSVYSIGKSAFRSCYGLTSVTMGSGVAYIGSYAFALDDYIMQMTCYAVAPTLENVNAFHAVNRGIPLYVPEVLIDYYQHSYGWSEFTNYQPIITEDIDNVDNSSVSVACKDGQIVVEGAEGNSVTLYDVNGRMLATKRDDNGPLRFDAPASGTYMIKIGNYPARKVAVVR